MSDLGAMMAKRKTTTLLMGIFTFCAMYCVFGDSLKRYYRPVGLKSSVSEYREGIRAAETMEAKAAESPEALRDWILKTGAETPLIHSKWYVDLWGEKYPEWTRQKRAEREFGRALLERLDEMAPEIPEMKDSVTRARTAGVLFDLAEWLRKEPGYGNAWLDYRLQDLGAVCMAYLIADLSFPDEQLRGLMKGIVEPSNIVRWQIDVVNVEAPGSPFSHGNPGAMLNIPENQWYKGYHRCKQWAGDHDLGKTFKMKRELLPKRLAFFVDAPLPKPWTTLNIWDLKWHQRLVLGWYSINIPHIQDFFTYRMTVGAFPTEPPPRWKLRGGDLPGHPGFEALDAALDHAYPRELNYPGGAALVYYDVIHNMLLAEDEHRVQMANMHRAWMIEHNVGSPAKPKDPGNPDEIPSGNDTERHD
jgi:hypothetical protein